MIKYIIYHIVAFIVILILLIARYGILCHPDDAYFRSLLKFKHENLVFSISEAFSNRKLIGIKISELPECCFNNFDYVDIENNSIVSFYNTKVSIVPGFIFINKERIIETKFCIDKEGFVIVYSYFLPQREKNVLVTINKPASSDNSFKDKTNSVYVQSYMTESELIPFLNEKGFAINKLYLDIPTGGSKVISRPKSIALDLGELILNIAFIILIMFSVFSSSILIYKKRKYRYSYSLLILSAALTIFPLFYFGYDLVWYLTGAFILSFIVLIILILREKPGS
jgi:hypothetical protein